MNDRELLELAAKAANIGGGWGSKYTTGQTVVDLTDMWFIDDSEFYGWNPLTDDGDALRLAVNLKIDLMFFEGYQEIHADSYHREEAVIEPYSSDMQQSVRRAITRAAAEIGKTVELLEDNK